MDIFAQERDRLLSSTTRTLGIACAGVSLVALAFPGVTEPAHLALVAVLVAALVAALVVVGRSGSRWAVLGGMAAGLAATVVALLPFGTPADAAVATAVIPLAGGANASFAFVLSTSRIRVVTAAAAFAVSVACVSLAWRSARCALPML